MAQNQSEERADKELQEGKFREFSNVHALLRDLHGVVFCNVPDCNTCPWDCPWKGG